MLTYWLDYANVANYFVVKNFIQTGLMRKVLLDTWDWIQDRQCVTRLIIIIVIFYKP